MHQWAIFKKKQAVEKQQIVKIKLTKHLEFIFDSPSNIVPRCKTKFTPTGHSPFVLFFLLGGGGDIMQPKRPPAIFRCQFFPSLAAWSMMENTTNHTYPAPETNSSYLKKLAVSKERIIFQTSISGINSLLVSGRIHLTAPSVRCVHRVKKSPRIRNL